MASPADDATVQPSPDPVCTELSDADLAPGGSLWMTRHLRRDLLLRDAFIAALREELRAQSEALRQREAELAELQRELARVHQSIARTLSQPRYLLADRANTFLRCLPFVHLFFKQRIRGAPPPASQ